MRSERRDNDEGAGCQPRLCSASAEATVELGYSSKLNAEWEFIAMLHQEGRRSAEAFLAENRNNIGQRSSVDLDILLQGV